MKMRLFLSMVGFFSATTNLMANIPQSLKTSSWTADCDGEKVSIHFTEHRTKITIEEEKPLIFDHKDFTVRFIESSSGKFEHDPHKGEFKGVYQMLGQNKIGNLTLLYFAPKENSLYMILAGDEPFCTFRRQ